MAAPGITRHRRPFLAPLWVSLLVALVLAGIAWAFYHDATTTVVLLVRVADKEPGTIEDPPLSQEGEARAQRLAQMFGDPGSLDGLYESDERRAQQTAAALAERLHRAPVVFGSGEAGAAAGRILREHAGGTVLVVASAAVLAQMLHELAGAAPMAGTDEASVMYVVSVPSVGRAHLTRIRL